MGILKNLGGRKSRSGKSSTPRLQLHAADETVVAEVDRLDEVEDEGGGLVLANTEDFVEQAPEPAGKAGSKEACALPTEWSLDVLQSMDWMRFDATPSLISTLVTESARR